MNSLETWPWTPGDSSASHPSTSKDSDSNDVSVGTTGASKEKLCLKEKLALRWSKAGFWFVNGYIWLRNGLLSWVVFFWVLRGYTLSRRLREAYAKPTPCWKVAYALEVWSYVPTRTAYATKCKNEADTTKRLYIERKVWELQLRVAFDCKKGKAAGVDKWGRSEPELTRSLRESYAGAYARKRIRSWLCAAKVYNKHLQVWEIS